MNVAGSKTLLLSGAVFAVLSVLVHFAAATERGRIEQEVRGQVGEVAITHLSRLEAELNANVFLANGMVAHILAQNGVVDDSAERALQALHQYGRHVRNIGIAPGNRISRIYPLTGNEAAIGLYYPDVPSQWPAVRAAIESRTTVMAGPVALRQGGRGLISRTPVFFPDGRYWGIVSIVLDLDEMLRASGLATEVDGIFFAIRGTDGKGAGGEVFFGDARLFGAGAQVFEARVPGGTWQLAALPRGGWDGDAGHLLPLEAAGITLSLILAATLFGYLRSRQQLALSERRTAALIDGAMDAACLLSPDGAVVAANQALATRFDIGRDELIGRIVYDFFPESVAKLRRETIQSVVRNNRTHHFSDQRNGMFMEHSVCPIVDTHGAVAFVGVYSRDVTGHITLQQRYFDKMQQLDAILACSSVGISLVRDRVQIWCNEAMIQMFGYTAAEMSNQSTRRFYPDDAEYEQLGRAAYEALAGGKRFSVERQMRRKDGSLFWARMLGTLLNKDDPAAGSIWTFEDVTERKKSEAESALAASVFHEALQAIMVTDPAGTILSVNDAFCRITGYDRHEAVGQTPRLLKSKHHDRTFYDEFWRQLTEKGRFEGELWNRRKSGEVFLVWQTVSAIRDGEGRTVRYVALFSDVTDLRRDDLRIRHIAFHDALTDLPNRILLRDRLGHALTSAERAGTSVALLFLDLDGFKAVNDTLGHDIGDDLLKEVASRLLHAVRTSDTVSRLGGDEFVVVLENPSGHNEIVEIAGRIIASVNEPMELRDHPARVGTSMGIAIYPDDTTDGEALIANADAAMYVAKKSGKNSFRFYSAP